VKTRDLARDRRPRGAPYPRPRRAAWLPALAVVLGVVLAGGALLLRRVGGAPAAGGGPPSIAVLPFEDMSPGHTQEHLADGIAEEILMGLSRVEGLHVAGRTSSFSFKGRPEDLRTMGQRLRVATVLEGSVRRDGDRLRVTAQLVNVADGYRLWSETFDRGAAELFQTEDEIARSVVRALEARLLAGGAARLPAVRRTSPEAYDEYLHARSRARRATQEDTEAAVAALDRALALDPRYAPAWALLAGRRLVLADFAESPAAVEQLQSRAADAAARALELEPDLPDALVSRAEIRQGRYQWAGALLDADRAVALAPGDPVALFRLASLRANLGDVAGAVPLARRGVEIDPLHAAGWNLLGSLLLQAGELDEAGRTFDRVLAEVPGAEAANFNRGVVSVLQGKPAEALETFRRNPAEMYLQAGSALALHGLGRREESDAALRAVTERHGHTMAYQIAQVHAWRGERDLAFEWLDRAVAQHDGGLEQVTGDPLLRSLRGDPRFPALLARLGIPAR
jgi:TolB-like protein/tetratricopeptide (TPR) repeat protein